MTQVITPTPGRIVWYWPSTNDGLSALAGQPLAAIVAAVHDDRHVNLSVIDAHGNHHGRTNVFLSQPDQERPTSRDYGFAEWMPYQKGQAAKTEQAVAVAEGMTAIAGVAATLALDVATSAQAAEISTANTGVVLTEADAAADLAGEPRPDNPSVSTSDAPTPTE